MDDHLVVKLALPSAPIHTNGKWDPAKRQVVGESDLDGVEGDQRLPMFCFASWGTANESFQKAHFGKVIAEGEDLLKYCLWRASLTARQAEEWEARLASLKPGKSIAGELDAFRFTEEPAATSASDKGQAHLLSAFPRELFKAALTK